MTNDEANPNAQMTKAAAHIASFGFRHSFGIRHSSFVIRSAFHLLANRTAAIFMKLLFGWVARVRVLRRENAPLRPGASTLAHIAAVPVLPCVIIGSDRLYGIHRWLRLRSNPIWIAFGDPVPCFPDLPKSIARQRIEHEVTAAFQKLYLELRDKFQLTPDDLPHSPQERMKRCRASASLAGPGIGNRSGRPTIRRNRLRHVAATAVDSLMCASINLLQSRHRLHARSREEMERYVSGCEKLTVHEFYAAP